MSKSKNSSYEKRKRNKKKRKELNALKICNDVLQNEINAFMRGIVAGIRIGNG